MHLQKKEKQGWILYRTLFDINFLKIDTNETSCYISVNFQDWNSFIILIVSNVKTIFNKS